MPLSPRWLMLAPCGASTRSLWNLYAAHFNSDAIAGPAPDAVAAALNRIGSRRVAFDETRVTLAAGMEPTFNGIAQGRISDRACDLLRREGLGHSAVDMRESSGCSTPTPMAFHNGSGLRPRSPLHPDFTWGGRHFGGSRDGVQPGRMVHASLRFTNRLRSAAVVQRFRCREDGDPG